MQRRQVKLDDNNNNNIYMICSIILNCEILSIFIIRVFRVYVFRDRCNLDQWSF